MVQTRPHCFVLTGGPGAGKTTLIAALAARGYACVPESGRAIIMEQGKDSLTVDPPVFAADMMRRDIANYDSAPLSGPVFFDHAAIGNIAYARLKGFDPDPDLVREARRRRFNRIVFAAPPWREIYVNDAQRTQTWEGAVRTHELLRTVYAEEGYTIVELPLASVDARAEFVLTRSAQEMVAGS